MSGGFENILKVEKKGGERKEDEATGRHGITSTGGQGPAVTG